MTQTSLSSLPGIYPLAGSILVQLRALFDDAVVEIARQCSSKGKLNAALLDQHQFVSYELALASADLLSAEIGCLPDAEISKLDADLALVAAGEALVSVTQRLETVYMGAGMGMQQLHALAHSADMVKFRTQTGHAGVLASIGAQVATADDVGAVNLSESVAMARDAFHRFAQEVVKPLAEDIHRENLIIPQALLQGMREMGAFGLSIPEEYGGSASNTSQDVLMMIAVTETLSEASLAAAGSLITRPEILSRALLAGGTDQQKQDLLPKIAAGELLCGIAITEPDFGSDVASLALKGDRTEGGWILNGAKTWCTFAGKANLLMVVTRTDTDRSAGHRGLSIMLVEKPSHDGHVFAYAQEGGGLLTGRAIPTIGYRGMHSFDLHFENFFVPDDRLLGGEGGLGKGFYYTMAGMTGGRMQTAARASGVMRAALYAAIRYAQDRRVFGSALMNMPLTQVKIAKMAARYSSCRKLTYAIGQRLEEGGSQMEASLAKLLTCRSAELVTREALQIHGGMGYAEECPVSRYFVDARVLSIFEGAEETLALKIIAKSLFEAALARSNSAVKEPAHVD
ncbi:acyl-CoA dehydrogenase family protein [Polaromonas glacialis]|uniref:acyl-CoA dehydrogenase family protein n=1 Tax=Polaromonas glacialis TaxID=866564 RepID=UPI00068B738A|nr:acyl-CoA dehydrogenase family protein [Polaromonas glacialis]